MKKITASLIAGTLALVGASAVPAQSGHDLFQQALVQERVEGNLEGAIQLYSRVVAEYPSDRALGARALMQMGRSYERLRDPEARNVYQRVARDYSDQDELADAARARLAAMESGEPTPDDRGIVVRQVWARSSSVSSVSPDGRYIAFTDWIPGFGGDSNLIGHADLAVYDVQTGRSRVLTNRVSQSESDSYVQDAIWSPSGDRLAYNQWTDKGRGFELHLIDADGTGDRILLTNAEWQGFETADWSSNGDFILVGFTGWDELHRIATISVDDGSLSVLKTLGRHAPARPLSLSPDGRFVVYDYLQDDGDPKHDVFILATDGSSESRLVTGAADDDRPLWTPDGERVLFLSDRSGRPALWSVAVSDGEAVAEPEIVRPDVGTMVPIGFSRQGDLYYRSSARMLDVYAADLDLTGNGGMGEPVPFTDRYVGTNSRAAWSVDGTSVAYVSYRGPGGFGSAHIVVRSLDTGQEREFPLGFATHRFTHPVWSSDGEYIMIQGIDPERTSHRRRGSYRLELATGEVVREQYLRDAAAVGGGWPRFASDRQIAGLRSAGIRLLEHRTDAESLAGVSEQLLILAGSVFLAPPGRPVQSHGSGVTMLHKGLHIHSWALSPDGRRIAFAVAEDSTRSDWNVSRVLRVMPVEGGEAVEVTRVGDDQEIIAIRWTPDGNTLLFAAGVGDGHVADGGIWRVPVDGGEPILTDLPLTAIQLVQLDFHPDRSRVAFSTGDMWAEIWAMGGFPWTDEAGP